MARSERRMPNVVAKRAGPALGEGGSLASATAECARSGQLQPEVETNGPVPLAGPPSPTAAGWLWAGPACRGIGILRSRPDCMPAAREPALAPAKVGLKPAVSADAVIAKEPCERTVERPTMVGTRESEPSSGPSGGEGDESALTSVLASDREERLNGAV